MNNFIKSLMEENNLKQKDLAAILGVSASALSQWSDDASYISIENLFSLSKLFHVTVDELIDGKRSDESIEDKWKRDFNVDVTTAREAMLEHDKNKLLQCLESASRVNDRFFALFEKKIDGKISNVEFKEWTFLRHFYTNVDIRRSRLIEYLGNSFFYDRTDNLDEFIFNKLQEKYGVGQKEAILWELKKIYKIEDFGIDDSILCDYNDDLYYETDNVYGEDIYIDKDIFFAWYKILTPVEKDEKINDEFNGMHRIDCIYELLKRGGNLLYSRKDLYKVNYNYSDLENLEGEKKSADNFNEAQIAFSETGGNCLSATYEQYLALINHSAMKQIENEVKYKVKNPIRYWEYIIRTDNL